MQGPERTDPATEDAPYDESQGEEADAPEQAPVNRMRREERHRPDERIGEEIPFDGERQADGGIGLCREASSKRRLEEEIEKESEEERLREPPRPHEPANHATRGDP